VRNVTRSSLLSNIFWTHRADKIERGDSSSAWIDELDRAAGVLRNVEPRNDTHAMQLRTIEPRNAEPHRWWLMSCRAFWGAKLVVSPNLPEAPALERQVAALDFLPPIAKVDKCLSGWSASLLNHMGRAVLVNSVLDS
jgi:hypothetical protein